MIIGIVGASPLGADLAYGLMSALARLRQGKVLLQDPQAHALESAIAQVTRAMEQDQARGKLSAKAAAAISAGLSRTTSLAELASCELVLDASSAAIDDRRALLAAIEAAVSPACLIGVISEGLPRALIAAAAKHPGRVFVVNPLPPAARALPLEVVPSDDPEATGRLLAAWRTLGKIPLLVADTPCFAAGDLLASYCAEAVRLAEAGLATPAQIDAIASETLGGGAPFALLDRLGNAAVLRGLQLLQGTAPQAAWLQPPASLSRQGKTAWHDATIPGPPSYTPELAAQVRDRLLGLLLGRCYSLLEREVIDPTELDWLTRRGLGFSPGLLEQAETLGADRVHALCTDYATQRPGFPLPRSVAQKQLPAVNRTVTVSRAGELALVTVFRPEVKNALSALVLRELDAAFATLADDPAVRGVILSSSDGSLAGADITELARLTGPDEAAALSRRGQRVIDRLAQLGKPVVAAINGPVMGGGAELCMGCHARVVGPALLLAQPEVNLGIIPGYGGTQRLPRLIGLERAVDLLRTGRAVGAQEACAWGWATGEPETDVIGAARRLLQRHLAGELQLAPVDPAPLPAPANQPAVDLGHHSRAIDTLLLEVLQTGLSAALPLGLEAEAVGFGRCVATEDFAIGMKNFLANGPRTQASFLHR